MQALYKYKELLVNSQEIIVSAAYLGCMDVSACIVSHDHTIDPLLDVSACVVSHDYTMDPLLDVSACIVGHDHTMDPLLDVSACTVSHDHTMDPPVGCLCLYCKP